ncbi:hypothetical protein K503DRAFT_530817 [Rhizopogon vinicolor AM-OR11-026]|uniref:Protein kinase domain-containing protein n=1 Tax=Rhizopogon vinicolor AM-OR11-026 TaxID=1314800 RepID=A0A1B7ML53_9AGAM|nr:hypothetical protein K503DRAFT_530817 [Rhizopogon vinicolor AM-OR11-026]
MPMAGAWLVELSNPDAQLMSVAKQLFAAVDFIHQHGVAHLDLKPPNILIPWNGGRLSIIDFSASVCVKGVHDTFRGVVGTAGYLPPEIMASTVLFVRTCGPVERRYTKFVTPAYHPLIATRCSR